MQERFHPPISVEWGDVGSKRQVSTTREIAELLMHPRWPVHGECHRTACEAALARQVGAASIEAVRVAFRIAAEEAGILLGKD